MAQDYSTISPRPELDLILLKMTDELVKVDVDPYAANLIANARKLVQLYPNAVLVDPIESQILTIDRESMHQFFEQVNALPQGTLFDQVIVYFLSRKLECEVVVEKQRAWLCTRNLLGRCC